jgi:molecular chaperone GrpE
MKRKGDAMKRNDEKKTHSVNEEKDIQHNDVKNIQNNDANEKQENEITEINKTEDKVKAEVLENKITELEKEAASFKDKFLRKAAEFENYKRRSENDQINLLKYSGESFIKKFLTVVDDFERSLLFLEKAADIESVKAGVKLVYEKLLRILEEQGVKKIDAVGQPFDVNYHEAVMQRKAPEGVEPHTVLDEIEKGYMYLDKVIRHSKVIVSEDLTEHEPAQFTGNKKDNNTEQG